MKPDFQNAMKKMQKAQADMARVQDELAEETVEASMGGGAVRIVMTGDFALRSLSIDPAAVDPDDVSILEDLVSAAFNEAIRRAQDLQKSKYAAIMGGMGLPGGLGLPGM